MAIMNEILFYLKSHTPYATSFINKRIAATSHLFMHPFPA